jgi:hypothetical protein
MHERRRSGIFSYAAGGPKRAKGLDKRGAAKRPFKQMSRRRRINMADALPPPRAARRIAAAKSWGWTTIVATYYLPRLRSRSHERDRDHPQSKAIGDDLLTAQGAILIMANSPP